MAGTSRVPLASAAHLAQSSARQTSRAGHPGPSASARGCPPGARVGAGGVGWGGGVGKGGGGLDQGWAQGSRRRRWLGPGLSAWARSTANCPCPSLAGCKMRVAGGPPRLRPCQPARLLTRQLLANSRFATCQSNRRRAAEAVASAAAASLPPPLAASMPGSCALLASHRDSSDAPAPGPPRIQACKWAQGRLEGRLAA